MLTIKEVVKMLGVSRTQVYVLRERGDIDFVTDKKNPNIVSYKAASIRKFIKKLTDKFSLVFIPSNALEYKNLITNREALSLLSDLRKSRLTKVLQPKGFTLDNGGPQIVFDKDDLDKFKRSLIRTDM